MPGYRLHASDTPLPLPWKATAVTGALGLALVLALFAQTWRGMFHVWTTSETFGHGPLVPLVSAWLVWRRRAVVGAVAPSPSVMGVLALAVCAAGWLVAEIAGVDVVAQFAVTAMIPALFVAVAGPAAARTITFPLLFLFFMVPAGEWFNPPLMEATADATVWALRASGLPVFREGLHFTLPTGRWSVVEACSGLRYVIAAAVLGALFAYLNFSAMRKRVLFFAAAVGIALVANWARAYVIVMVGHFSGMRWGVGDDHVVYGWVFFGLVMFGVFALGARWRDADQAPEAILPASLAGAPRGNRIAVATAAALVLAAAPALAAWLQDVQVRGDFESLAAARLGAPGGATLALQPSYSGARATVHGVSGPAEYYAAYFARQERGHEMIAFGNGLLGDARDGWSPMAVTRLEVSLDGRPVGVQEWRLRKGDQERLAWTWFTVGGRDAASDYAAKALGAWAVLRGAGDHSVVAVVSAPIDRLPAAASANDVGVALEAARARLVPAAARVAQLAMDASTLGTGR